MGQKRHPIITLIALERTLQADQLGYAQKQHRDRQIAIDAGVKAPQDQINAWLNKQCSEESHKVAERWLLSWHLIELILFAMGLLAGSGLASLSLHYDGQQPINIIAAWVILVALPFILMCFWLLTLLPFKFPLLSFLSQGLQRAFFAPLSGFLFKLLNKKFEHLTQNGSSLLLNEKILLSLTTMLMQCFALGLAIGVLLTTLYLLASSDLAFAWSTSYGFIETNLHSITSTLSLPFSSFFADAAPSQALINSSHYFRLEAAQNNQFSSPGDAKQLSQWWPFLVLSIVFYSVLPRFVSLFISALRLKHNTQTQTHSLPDYAGLIARMNAPLITTTHDNSPSNTASHIPAPVAPKPMQFKVSAPLVNWGQIPVDNGKLELALTDMGLTSTNHFQAGGELSTEDDARLIQQLHNDNSNAALVMVKAWEPPMHDFKDWLTALRQHLSGTIIILLLDPDNKSILQTDLDMWREDLYQLADAALYVEALNL